MLYLFAKIVNHKLWHKPRARTKAGNIDVDIFFQWRKWKNNFELFLGCKRNSTSAIRMKLKYSSMCQRFIFLFLMIPRVWQVNPFSRSNDWKVECFSNSMDETICSPSAYSWNDVIHGYALIVPALLKGERGLQYPLTACWMQILELEMESVLFLHMTNVNFFSRKKFNKSL